MFSRPFSCALVLLSVSALAADPVKRIPPPGVAVPEAVRMELENGARELAFEVAKLKKDFHSDAKKLPEIPSVEIFHKAVDWALKYDEFFDAKQFDTARDFLAQGMQRAKDLRAGTPGWNEASGLVVRAYRSSIDGSVQPYGLVVPPDWTPKDTKPRALHLWCHGRGEKLSELSFIADRQKNKGEFTPEGAIVLHLYGRYCCANKFAGEVDAFEAMRDVGQHYKIDATRLVVRGFSMGGASAWQFATHFPGTWAAAAPGAGFAETAEFFRSFGQGKTPPPWWEQVLWRWYDATTVARNLSGLPLVAYSGEIDGQKQAAEIMIRYAKEEGIEIPHVIGPQTGHKYHPDSKPQIEKFISDALEKGRQQFPHSIKFTTYTLMYPERDWLKITGMEKHWERADVDASLDKDGNVEIRTKNIASLELRVPTNAAIQPSNRLVIDGEQVSVPAANAFRFTKWNGKWQVNGKLPETLNKRNEHKRPGVCGPIDHAFMSSFLHVRPTGKPQQESTGAWVKSEMEHATTQWRQVFRGDAPIKDDTAITEADIQASNLILWGDPSSNAVLKKIADKLPVKWGKDSLEFRGYKLEAASYAPILIFPNPLNPQKYVVVNSGHTFREKAALNNSDQTPKLPDWAIVDLRKPADELWPGLIYDAGFFDEQWK
jgi:hypothetical protein